MKICDWDYCKTAIGSAMVRCPSHRDMKWWEEYVEHVEHLCWEEEELPLDEFEDALDIIHDSRQAGGPRKAVRRLEEEHGLNPEVFGDRWKSEKELAEESLLSGGERVKW